MKIGYNDHGCKEFMLKTTKTTLVILFFAIEIVFDVFYTLTFSVFILISLLYMLNIKT